MDERFIRRATARIIAYRFKLENERRAKMSRLSEKLKHASGVVSRQTAKIEARADAIIARESQLEVQTEEAFKPHEALLSEAERGLESLSRELAVVSNDPLGSSGESPQAAPVDAPGYVGISHPNNLGLDAAAYRKFEAGMPLETAKDVNGS